MIARSETEEERRDRARCEYEANWFAAAFLMPEARFCQEWNKASGDVGAVAALYKLPIAIVRLRAQGLGLT